MKSATVGVRMHSGWGVLVVVSGDIATPEILDRRRIVITGDKIPGIDQPYHYAASLPSLRAEKYLAECAAISERLALIALTQLVRELKSTRHKIVSCAILVASGRPLPSLPQIFASHVLIHAAEGEFFRSAVAQAFKRLRISVSELRERDLAQHAKAAFGNFESRVQRKILGVGASLGPPWTMDQKNAGLASLIAFEGRRCQR